MVAVISMWLCGVGAAFTGSLNAYCWPDHGRSPTSLLSLSIIPTATFSLVITALGLLSSLGFFGFSGTFVVFNAVTLLGREPLASLSQNKLSWIIRQRNKRNVGHQSVGSRPATAWAYTVPVSHSKTDTVCRRTRGFRLVFSSQGLGRHIKN